MLQKMATVAGVLAVLMPAAGCGGGGATETAGIASVPAKTAAPAPLVATSAAAAEKAQAKAAAEQAKAAKKAEAARKEKAAAKKAAAQKAEKAKAGKSACNPSYVGACVPNDGRDHNCPEIGAMVRVVGPDTDHLDRDGNGKGCESYG